MIYLYLSGIRAHLHSTAGSRTVNDYQLAGLYHLVFQYTPALLHLGIMVWDYSWYRRTPGTGDAAMLCVQVSLYLFRKSNAKQKYVGYELALHLALRMCSPYHSSLPASAFLEGKGEAMLSRLAWAMGEDTIITSVVD